MKFPIEILDNGYMATIDCCRLKAINDYLSEKNYIRTSKTHNKLHYLKPNDIKQLLLATIDYTENYLFDIENSTLYVFCKFPEEVSDLQVFIDKLYEYSEVKNLIDKHIDMLGGSLLTVDELKNQFDKPIIPDNVFDSNKILGLELPSYCIAAYQSGFYKQALLGFIKAKSLFPDMNEINYNIAIICYELNLFKLAVTFFEEINEDGRFDSNIEICKKVANL